MDTSVQSGDGRFGRRLTEGVKCARLLGWHQTVVNVCRVCELLDAEHFGEDVRCRAGLRSVSGGVARKMRRHELWHPATIDIAVDVGHRSQQVVSVFGIPGPNKCVMNGDANKRVCLGSLCQRETFVSSNLAHDGNPVPRRSAGSPGTVGPELGDCLLLISESRDHISGQSFQHQRRRAWRGTRHLSNFSLTYFSNSHKKSKRSIRTAKKVI